MALAGVRFTAIRDTPRGLGAVAAASISSVAGRFVARLDESLETKVISRGASGLPGTPGGRRKPSVVSQK